MSSSNDAIIAIFETADVGKGSAVEVGRVWFDGHAFQSNGLEKERLQEILGRFVLIGPRRYTAENGEEYIKILPAAFDGIYFWARLEPAHLMEELRARLDLEPMWRGRNEVIHADRDTQ